MSGTDNLKECLIHREMRNKHAQMEALQEQNWMDAERFLDDYERIVKTGIPTNQTEQLLVRKACGMLIAGIYVRRAERKRMLMEEHKHTVNGIVFLFKGDTYPLEGRGIVHLATLYEKQYERDQVHNALLGQQWYGQRIVGVESFPTPNQSGRDIGILLKERYDQDKIQASQ